MGQAHPISICQYLLTSLASKNVKYIDYQARPSLPRTDWTTRCHIGWKWFLIGRCTTWVHPESYQRPDHWRPARRGPVQVSQGRGAGLPQLRQHTAKGQQGVSIIPSYIWCCMSLYSRLKVVKKKRWMLHHPFSLYSDNSTFYVLVLTAVLNALSGSELPQFHN